MERRAPACQGPTVDHFEATGEPPLLLILVKLRKLQASLQAPTNTSLFDKYILNLN